MVVVRDRLPEIADSIAANFNKPAVYLLVLHLSRLRSTAPVEPVNRMKNTKVGAKLKELIKTGTLQQRFEIGRTAIAMFADDKEVIEIYEKDILNPEFK